MRAYLSFLQVDVVGEVARVERDGSRPVGSLGVGDGLRDGDHHLSREGGDIVRGLGDSFIGWGLGQDCLHAGSGGQG